MSQKEQIINRIETIRHFKVFLLFACLVIAGIGVWQLCIGNKLLGYFISVMSVVDYLILSLLLNLAMNNLKLKMENKNGELKKY